MEKQYGCFTEKEVAETKAYYSKLKKEIVVDAFVRVRSALHSLQLENIDLLVENKLLREKLSKAKSAKKNKQ